MHDAPVLVNKERRAAVWAAIGAAQLTPHLTALCASLRANEARRVGPVLERGPAAALGEDGQLSLLAMHRRLVADLLCHRRPAHLGRESVAQPPLRGRPLELEQRGEVGGGVVGVDAGRRPLEAHQSGVVLARGGVVPWL